MTTLHRRRLPVLAASVLASVPILSRAQVPAGNTSLQAAVEVFVPERLSELVRDVDLAELCITSAGTTRLGPVPDDAFSLPDVPEIGVRVSPAAGARCERCWRVLPEVGEVPEHADLCRRCAAVVALDAAPGGFAGGG